MRLIDVDIYCSTICNCNRRECDRGRCPIHNAPTAYDIDKVVEELESLTDEECTLHECGIRSERCRPCIAKKAIEIVKHGGVSDNESDYCEWIKYDYRTIAPREHDVNNPYWRIPENMDKLKYCPYCGKKIKVVE